MKDAEREEKRKACGRGKTDGSFEGRPHTRELALYLVVIASPPLLYLRAKQSFFNKRKRKIASSAEKKRPPRNALKG
jgi:hypothetical protein